MNNFHEFKDRDAMWDFSMKYVKENSDGIFGVSGGSAGEIMTFVSGNECFLVDERKVEYKSEFCNCRILREYTSENKVRCMYHDDDYLDLLPKKLELAVMGVGRDGHLASLFSGSEFDQSDLIVDTFTKHSEVNERISLSMKYLLKSKKVLFLLMGQSKKEIWNKIKNNQVGGLAIGYFMDNYEGELVCVFAE